MRRWLKRDPKGWVAIAWAPYSRRSEMFARELGGELNCIHYLRFQTRWQAPLRYPLQALKTLYVLFRDRPAAVHVQNPPNFCGLTVHWYCRLVGAQFVIEHHSAAFDPAWRWLLPLTKFIVRRATVNIVTDDHWAELVESWGGSATVMYDPFLDLPEGTSFPLKDGFNLAFISTFAPDEPVDEVLAAAAETPEVNLYITGDHRKRTRAGYRPAPPNVEFTGFLDMNGSYLGLLRGADAVMVLTTRDHTLQLAGCEAIAIGKPLITSDFPYLRHLFSSATVHVPNTAEGIRRGIEQIVRDREVLSAELDDLRRVRRAEWQEKIEGLRALTNGSKSGQPHLETTTKTQEKMI